MNETSTQDALDTDELMHLAIADARNGHHDRAIERLKKVLASEPENANATFMLAAEHAEIGMYDRAVEGFRKALELDEQLHTARFQLGLLLYTSRQVDEAREAWKGLDKLDSDDALRLFPEALLCLVDNDAEKAMEKLETAISKDRSNPALVNDMKRILADLRRQTGTTAEESSEPGADDEAAASKHIFLSNYEKNSDNDD